MGWLWRIGFKIRRSIPWRRYHQGRRTYRRMDSDSRHSLFQVIITYKAGMEIQGKFWIKSCIGHSTHGAVRCVPRSVSEQVLFGGLKFTEHRQRGNLVLPLCIFTSLNCIRSCIIIFIAAIEKKINMFCIAPRKLLSPVYLICDAIAYILIYCGGTKIIFSIFISLSAYHKYKSIKIVWSC